MGAGGDTPLQRMARRAAREREQALERCDLCGAAIAAEHRHLLDLRARELMCACRPCAVLFDRGAAGGGHYRLVPDRRLRVEDFRLDDAAWADLRLPVDLAFFVHDSDEDRVRAYYPGPMGATESLLGLDAWKELEAANPVLATLAPDVEALLVDRAQGARHHFIVPIDDCFALVGLIRTHWKGLTGGRDVWAEIVGFFDRLDRRARPAGGHHRMEGTWAS
ncbi:MAG TPA: DUF5947 family protein [Solirubrobacteraceae bacterium]|nr:DUF5947 family protein [Solirubrobacteraceae bacterium]